MNGPKLEKSKGEVVTAGDVLAISALEERSVEVVTRGEVAGQVEEAEAMDSGRYVDRTPGVEPSGLLEVDIPVDSMMALEAV